MSLRWKRNPRPTGLAGVCCGNMGSVLREGEKEYASTNYSEGKWGNSKGWFWSCRDEAQNKVINTCREPVENELEAKKAASDYVKAMIKRDNF